MKNLKLAFMRIRDDFSNQRLIMTLYVVGSAICVIVFLYCFSSVPSLIQQYINILNTPNNRTYEVSFYNATEITQNDLNFLCDYSVENISLVANTSDTFESYVTVSSAEYLTRGGASQELADKLLKTEDQMLLIKKGDIQSAATKSINGIDFEIIDCIELNYDNVFASGLISLDSFMNHHFDTSSIFIVLSSALSSRDSSSFIEQLSKEFADKNITSISDPLQSHNDDLSENIALKILISVLLYIICFIVCGYLFKYIFDSNRRENIIYSLVGASKKCVVRIMLTEAVILSLSSFLLGLLAYIVFFGVTTYSFIECIAVMLIILFLSILTLIPFFILYLKNPILKTKNEIA